MRSVYVGGGMNDTGRVRQVQHAVVAAGGWITLDWTTMPTQPLDDWSTRTVDGACIAVGEVNACAAADLVIILSPPIHKGLGCWIELGAALATGSEVWVVEPPRESVFWTHPRVHCFKTFGGLLSEIERTPR